MWVSVAAATTDLRTLISDGPTDKNVYRKKLFGDTNAVNTYFRSFDRRRVTNFSDPTLAFPLGVFINGVRVANSGISADDPLSGEVTLATAPTNTQRVEASYYYQWFLDNECALFLQNATQWLGLGVDCTQIPDGLQPAALYYAAQEAMHKLCIWWSERQADMYLVEDKPDEKNASPVDMYRRLAEDYRKKSIELRDNYYKRQGQSLQPIFVSLKGAVRDYVPKR